MVTWLRGHKSEMVSLLISISLSVKEYIEEKWDWDQKWDCLAFMARSQNSLTKFCILQMIDWFLISVFSVSFRGQCQQECHHSRNTGKLKRVNIYGFFCWIQVCSNEVPRPFPREDDWEIAKINWRNLENLHLQNHWANFNQTWHKPSLGKGNSSLFKWRALHYFVGELILK